MHVLKFTNAGLKGRRETSATSRFEAVYGKQQQLGTTANDDEEDGGVVGRKKDAGALLDAPSHALRPMSE